MILIKTYIQQMPCLWHPGKNSVHFQNKLQLFVEVLLTLHSRNTWNIRSLIQYAFLFAVIVPKAVTVSLQEQTSTKYIMVIRAFINAGQEPRVQFGGQGCQNKCLILFPLSSVRENLRANDCTYLASLPLANSRIRFASTQRNLFFRYRNIVRLTNITSKGLVTALKPIVARHGVPVVLHSHN